MKKKIAVLLADGFEETEAIVPSDVLARLGCTVIHAGIRDRFVTGSHGFRIEASCLLKDLNADDLDAVFLPGGLPGATNLRDDPSVIALIRKMNDAGKIVSAICAAPIVLDKADVVKGRKVTGYPGSESMAEHLSYTGNRAESDFGIVTGKGPGASFDFAFALAEALGFSKDETSRLKGQMFVL